MGGSRGGPTRPTLPHVEKRKESVHAGGGPPARLPTPLPPPKVARKRWPPDLWAKAADLADVALAFAPTLAIAREALGVGERPWAIDLPPRYGGAGAPKRYMVASPANFAAAASAVDDSSRHAYEVIEDVPCRAFFDLESEAADEAAMAAADASAVHITEHAVAELVVSCWRQHHVTPWVDALTLDSHRPGKFSRHVVIRLCEAGTRTPILLAGPLHAGELARAVAARRNSGWE